MGRTGEASEQKMEHKNKKQTKQKKKKWIFFFFFFCSLRPEDDFKLKEQVQKGLEYQYVHVNFSPPHHHPAKEETDSDLAELLSVPTLYTI